MKFLFALLYVPTFSIAQNATNQTNTIFLYGISKDQAKAELIKLGFTAVDHDSTYFVTLPRQYKDIDHGSIILKVAIADSGRISLTGTYSQINNESLANPYGNRWKPIMKTVLYCNCKEAFFIMDKIAHSLPGQITYARL